LSANAGERPGKRDVAAQNHFDAQGESGKLQMKRGTVVAVVHKRCAL
jgi:hypothetical protein